MSDLSLWEPGEELELPSFPSAVLGYQRKAVDQYLKSLGETRNARATILVYPDAPVPTEQLNRYRDLGREIGDLLSVVQETARRIREQAELDADRWRGEATTEVQTTTAEAQATAEELRSAAWEVATQMIAQIRDLETETYRNVEKESQEIIAEAENETHRIREDARRRAEAIHSNANVESLEVEERTRALCDQMIESAEQQVLAIQERVLALERHRDQLLEEIGGIRSGATPIGVKLVDQTGGLIYRTSPPVEDPTHVTPHHEMSGLVKVIAPPGLPKEDPPSQPHVEPPRQPAPTVVEDTPSQDVGDEPEGSSSSHFQDLFSSLRQIPFGSSKPVVRRKQASAQRSAPQMGEEESRNLKEERLLPISNHFLRLFKRILTEEQNLVLEGIRTGELVWGVDEVDGRLRSHLEMLMEQSWLAGHSAAERMIRQNIPKPQMALGGETGFAPQLVSDVNDALGSAGPSENVTQRSLITSRMFRVWRSEKLERQVQEISTKYYQQGLDGSLGAAGVSQDRGPRPVEVG